MSLSWGFSVGNVRAKEATLLKTNDLEQLASLSSEEQLLSALKDKGFGGADMSGSIDEILKYETEQLWEYARVTAADFKVFYPLLIDNDYHNLKTIIKGVLSGKSYDKLMLHPSVIDTETVEKAIKEKQFSLLPEFCSLAAKEAYEVLARTSDAQLADAILDKSKMEAAIKMSEGFIAEYVKIKVFYENIKTLIKAAKFGKDRDFIERAVYCFVPALENLKIAALSGEKEVLERISAKDILGSREAIEQYEKSPSAFEKYVDEKLMETVRGAKRITMGPEVLMAYVLARLREIKEIGRLASGIRTNSGEATIRERLRMLYD